MLVQTGQKTAEETRLEKRGQEGGKSEEELALEEGIEDRFPEEREFGPSVFVEPEDDLEKVFEKFLFSVGFRPSVLSSLSRRANDLYRLRRVMIGTLAVCL